MFPCRPRLQNSTSEKTLLSGRNVGNQGWEGREIRSMLWTVVMLKKKKIIRPRRTRAVLWVPGFACDSPVATPLKHKIEILSLAAKARSVLVMTLYCGTA